MSFSSPSNINLEKVEPLNQKRTLAFLNHWTMTTVSFLNQFSSVCESKLAEVDNKLQRTEDALSILEAKLSSIPGLEDVKTTPPAGNAAALTSQPHVSTPAPESNTSQAPSAEGVAAPDELTTIGVESTAATQDEATPAAEETKEANTEEGAARPPISKDPRYSSYFRMVSVGVPEQAVKIKMASEGLDPALLDNPMAPAPDGAPSEGVEQASDSDEELSSWSD